MRAALTRVLVQLRILDADGTVSLSSLVLIVAIAKLALAPVAPPALAALLLALLNYNAKKAFTRSGAKAELAIVNRMTEVERELKALTTVQSMRNLTR